MKLTNADLIRNREKELLVTVSGDLDRKGIKQLLEAKYRLELDSESLVCRDGDLVVHDNQVAYKVTFQALVGLSLLFDREGECLEADLFTVEDTPAGQAADRTTGGAYAAVSTGDQADTKAPDNGAYADIASGRETADDVPGGGAYAAVTAAETPVDEDADEGQAAESPFDPGDDRPAASMASSIAEMISEINQT